MKFASGNNVCYYGFKFSAGGAKVSTQKLYSCVVSIVLVVCSALVYFGCTVAIAQTPENANEILGTALSYTFVLLLAGHKISDFQSLTVKPRS